MVMLAKPYDPSIDPTGWWMSEKLDGVRALWMNGAFWTRNMKPIYAPEWFTHMLPVNIYLDGELWAGRGGFQRCVSIVRKQTPDAKAWADIQYRVFDAPYLGGPFEARIRTAAKAVYDTGVASHVFQEKCGGQEHFDAYMREVVSQGAEGVMLRGASSPYEWKRSRYLLKCKPVDDAEAVVVGYLPGTGKYEGMTGALVCNCNNRVVTIGTGLTDEDRVNPPGVGSRVTFTFNGLTDAGVPRFASYKGLRPEGM